MLHAVCALRLLQSHPFYSHLLLPLTPSPRPAWPLLQVLQANGFLYDSTINERWDATGTWPTSKDGGSRLYPYTMDSGIPQIGGACMWCVCYVSSVRRTGGRGSCTAWQQYHQHDQQQAQQAFLCCAQQKRTADCPAHLLPCLCDISLPQEERHPGLWEVPLWVLQTSNYPMDAYAMDPGGDVYALLKLNFDVVSLRAGLAET